MAENSHLINGRFLHSLTGWTALDAAYSAGDGDAHYGVAVLADGGSIEQAFAVPYVRSFTLSIEVKAIGGDLAGSNVQAIITDGNGNTLASLSLTGTADTWTANSNDLGLGSGTTYTLQIINNDFGADVRIDDVWLWAVPITRAAIAARVEAKLARLGSERSLSKAINGSLTEGDYTYAIDAGLRSLGAINPESGLPDVRYLQPGNVNVVIDAAQAETLERLQADYAVETDLTEGPHSEKRSQITANVQNLLGKDKFGSGGTAGQVTQRKLKHEAPDYEW